MTSIKTLPLLEGTKVIVLDEGVDAMYARKLIAGWIQMWKHKDPNYTIELLSFSDPKCTFQDEPEPFMSSNVNISDYYTVDINVIDIDAIREKDFDTLDHILKTMKVKSTVIIDCLTSLILFVGRSKALWFLERLSKLVPQVICVYRRDFIENKIPCIETLGTTYVRIEQFAGAPTINQFNYVVELIHRKIGGSILKQQELVIQNTTSYEIQSEKMMKQDKKLHLSENQKQKIESSFRIEMNESEMKQRREIVLPYIISTNSTNTSKIHYQPEDIDDIDEEDPDDDLCL
ncbi:elongator complex protein 5 [Calliopsis andreniformis]|uniref:elongator complex protein 5 n=1 Tax=Calliopsis andreniformis TaxID=337506 RepID=UPI003FCDFC04